MNSHLTLTFLLSIQMFTTFYLINRNNTANSKPNPFRHTALSASTRPATQAPPTAMRRQTQLELLVTAVDDAPYAPTRQNIQHPPAGHLAPKAANTNRWHQNTKVRPGGTSTQNERSKGISERKYLPAKLIYNNLAANTDISHKHSHIANLAYNTLTAKSQHLTQTRPTPVTT